MYSKNALHLWVVLIFVFSPTAALLARKSGASNPAPAHYATFMTAPVAADDEDTTFVNTAIDLDILANDTDDDGTIDPATLSVTVPASGTISIDATGMVTYTPGTGFLGTDSFTYSVRDDAGDQSNTATVTIVVVSPPDAVDDDVQTDEDMALTIDVLANDSDADGSIDTTTVTIVVQPEHGSAAENPSGKITYTPDPNFFGDDSLKYTVEDDQGNVSDTTTVTIEVVDVNDPPVAHKDTVSTPEDTTVQISVLDNDSDVDGTPAPGSVAITDSASHGDAVVAPITGTITYTPDADFFGLDTLHYTVKDDDGMTSSDTLVVINVLSVNDPPVAVSEAVSTDEDVAIAIPVLDNDTDIDGTLVLASVTVVVDPGHGLAVVDPATGEIEYTPDSDFFGEDSLDYTVDDNDGASSGTTRVHITINDINDPPVAVVDTAITGTNTAVDVQVLANDSDVDGSIVTATLAATGASDGTTTILTDGTITYTPEPGFEGTDTFTYTVRDDDSAPSNSATVTIIVTAPPTVVDDFVTMNEGDTAQVAVTANDSDADGLLLSSVSVVDGPEHGTANVNPATGEVEYTPDPNFSGQDSLDYTVEDSLGITSEAARVLITVTEDNDPPVANDDSGITTEDVPLDIDVLANDFDVEGAIDTSTVSVVSGPENGAASVDPATGTITYTPAANFFGEDSLVYTVKDTLAASSDPATVRITVTSENDLPLTVPDTVQATEDVTAIIDVAANDSDPDGSLNLSSVAVVVDPLQGAVTSIDPVTGAISYSPDANFFGNDSLKYTIQDDVGDTSVATTALIVVNSVNDPPTAVDDTSTTLEDTFIVVDILANDSDIDGGLNPASVAVIKAPGNGTFALNAGTGAMTYTPDPNFSGKDTLTYTVDDVDVSTSNVASVFIDVVEQNDQPIAVDDTVATDEDTPVDIDVTSNDISFDVSLDLTSVTIVSAPVHGSATVYLALGTIDYAPDADFSGQDTLKYTVANDDGDVSDTASVAITVNAVNDPPVANDDDATTPEDTAIDLDVKANDTDVDGSVVPGSVTILVAPVHGATAVDPSTGVITYTPAANFFGEDTLQYQVVDDLSAESDTALVSITVTDVNDLPVAVADSVSTMLDTPVDIDVLANDFDVDGTIDTTSIEVGLASNGTAAINSTGILTYTPDTGFSGIDSFTYAVRDDDNGQSNAATVKIRVGIVPVANDDLFDTLEDEAAILDILANDDDPDDNLDPGSVVIITLPDSGSTSINPATGEITYTPNSNFFGLDTLTYEVDDDDTNTSNEATVIINVASVNDTPVAVSDADTTTEDVSVVIDVLDNDSDLDGTLVPATVTIAGPPERGSASVEPNGDITYTPDLNFFGLDTLVYTVEDDSGAVSNGASVIVSVVSENDGPVTQPDSFAIAEDVSDVNLDVLDNDSDVDGSLEVSTLTIVAAPVHGTATVYLITGQLDYSPDADFAGQDSLKYTVDDNDGATSDTTLVLITVNNINDAPVALNDTVITAKGTSVEIDVTANDIDIDGTVDSSTLAVTQASDGITTLKPDGTITYTPDTGFFGSDEFSYTVRDDDGAQSNSATVTIIVTAPPTVGDDLVSMDEGDTVAVDVTANDSDSDGLDLSTLAIVDGPENGAASVDTSTGEITYIPDLDFSGQDSLDYTIADNLGISSDPATVLFTVNEDNDFPVANDDSATTPEDTPIAIDVLANDSDVEGELDSTSVTIGSAPQNGSAQVDGNTGVITYTPAADYFGADSLTYTVDDAQGAPSNETTVRITVTGENDLPVTVADTSQTNEDTEVAIDVLGNDTDPDGSLVPSSVNVAVDPLHGTTTIDPATGAISYMPAANFFGTDSLKYTVRDNAGDTSIQTSVLLTVASVNDAPTAGDESVSTVEDTPVDIDILANDADVDGEIDSTSVAVVLSPSNGSFSYSSTTGMLTYTPAQDFFGKDTLTYTVKDKEGATSNEDSVFIDVLAQSDTPVAVDDAAETDEDSLITIEVMDNDISFDVTLDPSSVSIETAPEHGNAVVTLATGAIVYTPDANFFGEDSLEYTVANDDGERSDTASVAITVNAVNDAPVAGADTALTAEDTPIDITVLANDNDVDGTLDPATVTILTPPATGGAQVNPANGMLSYTPAADFFGQDTLQYSVKDDQLAESDTATVLITVTDVNDPPVAVDDSAATTLNTAVQIQILDNDNDVDGSLVVTSLNISQANNGTTAIDPNGVLTYTPDTGFGGIDTLMYTVRDDDNALSNEATVVVRVGSIPVANNDTLDTNEDEPASVDVVANDTDPDGTIDATTVEIAGQPANGTVAVDSVTGEVTYTPDQDFSGADTFTYSVADDEGNSSNNATVTVAVAAVNDAPIAVKDSVATNEDTLVTIDVLDNDIEVDGSFVPDSVAITSGPGHGSASANAATGMVTYTPDNNFFGLDTLFYTVADDSGATSNEAVVVINVLSVNDAPVAVNDTVGTQEEVSFVFPVLDNDSDLEGTVDPATIDIQSGPGFGTLSIDNATGEVTYTPDPDSSGVDTLRYTVNDNEGGTSNSALVLIAVAEVNDPPVAVNDTTSTSQGGSVAIPVTDNDTDIDGTIDTSSLFATQASNGTTTLNVDGTITYAPDTGFNGVDTFTYTVEDDSGAVSNLATVRVTVTAAPVAVDDSVTTGEGQFVDIDVADNDSDSDGTLDLNTVTIVSGPEVGAATVASGTGVITYTPQPNVFGADSLTYTIRDDLGQTSNVATVRITITEFNDPPIANDDSATTSKNDVANIDVVANDSDIDGTIDSSTVLVTIQPNHGDVLVSPQGVIAYTPAPNFFGTDSLGYTVEDDRGAVSDTAKVVITVLGQNSPPVAVNDTAGTDEDMSLVIDVAANDSDPDGTVDGSTVEITDAPQHGSTAVDSVTGAITYAPDADFAGQDTLGYTVEDNLGVVSDTASVFITVNSVNDPPVAENDTVTTDEDVQVDIDILNNDSDVDGSPDPASVAVVSGPGHGSVVIDAGNGMLTYTPDPDFAGEDTLAYAVSDFSGGADTASVFVTVVEINDPPVAEADSVETTRNIPVSIVILDNDRDVDGTIDSTSLEIGLVTHGTTTTSPSGVVVYTPDTDFGGFDTFTYTVKDDDGAKSNVASVTIRIGVIPEAGDDAVLTNEDASLTANVLANDVDIDGSIDSTTVVIVTPPGSGTAEVDSVDGGITYTPDADFFGQDTLTYTVDDNEGHTSNVATLVITVSSVNDPPVAANDTTVTPEDTPVTVDVIANDTDVDGTLNPTTVALVGGAVNGIATVNTTTGAITFTPGAEFSGTGAVDYTVKDNEGAISDTATLVIDVVATNDPPLAAADAATTDEDTPVTIDILANDQDVDGVIDFSTVAIPVNPLNGSVSIDGATGRLTYTPNANFFGVDSLEYTVEDTSGGSSNPARVRITVNGINDAPQAVNDSTTTTPGTVIEVDVVANDFDVDGTIDVSTLTIASPPLNGSASLAGNGRILYTPDTGFTGLDRVLYHIEDDQGAQSNSASALVFVSSDGGAQSFTFQPTDDGQVKLTSAANNYGFKPTAKVESGTFVTYLKFEVSGLSGPVQSATLRLRVTDGASDGSSSGGSVFEASNNLADLSELWTEAVLTAGNAPAATSAALSSAGAVSPGDLVEFNVSNAITGNGTFSFCITSTSRNRVKYYTKEGISPPQLVVNTGFGSSNNTPVAGNDNAATTSGIPVDIDVTANDNDSDGTLDLSSVTIVLAPVNGTATVNSGTGEVTYTPDAGFTGTDTFSYTVKDDEGATSNVALVSVSVSTGGSGTLTFQPTDDGQVKVTAPAKNYGSKSTAKVAAGKFRTYLKFSVNGISGPVQSAVVRLRVTEGATDGSDSGGSIFQVSNDFSTTPVPWTEQTVTSGNAPDVAGTPLSTAGAVIPNQVVDFNVTSVVTGDGVYSFAITSTSGNQVKYFTKEGTTPPELIISTGTGGGGNNPPLANDDNAVTASGTAAVINVANNDSDSDGTVDASTVTVVTPPSNGTTSVNGFTGLVTYTPDTGFSGADTFSYTVRDDAGALSNIATVTVTVGSGNLPPVAGDDNAQTFVNTSTVIDVTINDSDSDGTIIVSTVALTPPPSNGTASVSSTLGLVTYTPNTGFTGTDTFGYTVEDNDGATSNVATVTVAVASDNGGSPTLTFLPIDDGQVKLTDPAKNYGSKSTTKVKSGRFSSYFKFNVTGVSGPVQSAKLRLQVTDAASDGSDSGGSVFLVSNNFSGSGPPWQEETLTSGNAPPVSGSPVSSLGAVAANQTVEFDLSGVVSGDGIFSFAITTISGNQVKYYTKEGLTPPQLLVVTGGSGGNTPPVAANDTEVTLEGVSVLIDVTANDGDSDGTIDLTTVTIVSLPTNGSAGVNSVSGLITYTPNAGFSGVDAFTYQVQDDDGALSNIATATVTVGSDNTAPVAADDAVTTFAEIPIAIDVTANDTDSDGTLDVTTITVVTAPGNGTAVVGTNGIVTYTSTPGFTGTDTFTYTVSDDDGAASNAAIVSVHVSGGGSDTFTFEPTDDAHVKPNAPGINNGFKGTLKVEKDKFVSYLKFNVTGLTGPVQSAKVRLRVTPDAGDGSNAGGTILQASNDFDQTSTPWTEGQLNAGNAPQIISGALSTLGAVVEDTFVEFNVAGAVTGNGIFSFCIRTESSNQVKYFSKDGDVSPQLVIQAITAGGGNNGPVAANDNASTVEGTAVVVDVLANDSDSDGTLDVTSVAIQAAPGNGTATADGASGTIVYTPNSGFVGTDTFLYTVKDDDGAISNLATVTVEVQELGSIETLTFQPTDDGQVKLTAPGTNYGTKGTAKVSKGKFSSYFKFNVSGVNGPVLSANVRLHVAMEPEAASETGGTIFPASNNFSDTGSAWVEETLTAGNAPDEIGISLSTLGAIPPDTTVEFDVTGAVTGNGIFSFVITSPSTDLAKYFTKDSPFPPELRVTAAMVAGTLLAENDAPQVTDDQATTPPGVPVKIDVLANDSDRDGRLKIGSVAAVTLPANGFVRLDPATGSLTYTPNEGFKGTDSFHYVVHDDRGLASQPAKVVVTVTEADSDLPRVRDQAVSTYSGVAVGISVFDNEAARPGTNGTAILTLTSPASHGTVRLNSDSGVITYLPDLDFVGADAFTYQLAGPESAGAPRATVSITVREVVPQRLAFLPTDDAFVRSSRPTDNFGASYELRATNGKAEFYSFLKFDLTGLTAPVQRAILRLYVFDDSDGGSVYPVSNAYRDSETPWREAGLVWDNAPEISGVPMTSFSSNGAGKYVDIEVTEAIAGAGVFSFGLSSHSADAAKYESKEASNPPELVVETGLPVEKSDGELADKDEAAAIVPTEISLSPNYPNPFNAGTTITYALPQDAKVRLEIYNVRGQLVRTLVHEAQTAGIKKVKWSGKDTRGNEVASGVYLMQLEVGQQKFARRIILQK